MKTISLFTRWAVALAVFLSGAAWAQVATLAELSGAAQAIPAAGAPRDLKKGDSLNQGDSVKTAAGSSAVIRFEDGQVVALTANSRFSIANYQYNKAEPAKSNVVFNLLEGGMRAVTGLIGKAKPENVTYKAANATIGIRGTDVVFAINGGQLVISVVNGSVSFSMGGQTVSIGAQQGASVNTNTPNMPIVVLPASAIAAALNQTSAGSALNAALQALNAAAVNVQGTTNTQAVQSQGQPTQATVQGRGTGTNSGSVGVGGGRPSGS
jgi:hypothetical protein